MVHKDWDSISSDNKEGNKEEADNTVDNREEVDSKEEAGNKEGDIYSGDSKVYNMAMGDNKDHNMVYNMVSSKDHSTAYNMEVGNKVADNKDMDNKGDKLALENKGASEDNKLEYMVGVLGNKESNLGNTEEGNMESNLELLLWEDKTLVAVRYSLPVVF